MAKGRRPLSDRDACESFKIVVSRIPVSELAKAANRSAECAKMWKKGRSLANGASLINMARNIPEIRVWLLGMIGEV